MHIYIVTKKANYAKHFVVLITIRLLLLTDCLYTPSGRKNVKNVIMNIKRASKIHIQSFLVRLKCGHTTQHNYILTLSALLGASSENNKSLPAATFRCTDKVRNCTLRAKVVLQRSIPHFSNRHKLSIYTNALRPATF